MIKIYISHNFSRAKPVRAFPLLKPMYDEEHSSSPLILGNFYRITEDIEECDVIILAHTLNAYHQFDKRGSVDAFLTDVRKYKKIGWVYSDGDFCFRFQKENVYHFRKSAYESRMGELDIMVPAWVQDPYADAALNLSFRQCPYHTVPRVGFCGHSTAKIAEVVKVATLVNLNNLKSLLSLSPFETDRQFYSPLHRKRALDRFKKSEAVKCDFIERDKYRAGVKVEKSSHITTKEYFENIYRNPYSVAIRGGGNFSIRFFHICAMGRIPIFINYDSPLPFREELLRRGLMVEINPASEEPVKKLMEFHGQDQTRERFEQLQVEMRQFWAEHFTRHGFFIQMHKRFTANIGVGAF